MLDYTEYIKIFVGMLAVIDPLGAVPIVVTLTSGNDRNEQKK